MARKMAWNFSNTYAQLPAEFFAHCLPTPVSAPQLIIFNRPLAEKLSMPLDASAAIFSGNEIPPEAEPLAQAYAGHQFAHFTMLGDGRAILLGEQVTAAGERFDLQLKGSGPTPFSRRGDGRAALGPMLREYIISEAMAALGVPTTRSLAVVATGEPVHREETLPGAVLTRVAASHLRVGTFEYAAARGDKKSLQVLADYTMARHYPEIIGGHDRYEAFLRQVMMRQAALVAQWMGFGFIHGVMNTDNTSIAGETIDYGPCAFMDAYDPATVFSSIDRKGRYAFANQPTIIHWNLTRLAEALLPLLADDQQSAVEKATAVLAEFPQIYEQAWLKVMRGKLGLVQESGDDRNIIDELLGLMHQHGVDYTGTFLALTQERPVAAPLMGDPAFATWLEKWRSHRSAGSVALMRESNPVVIPRNHRVEEALAAAVRGDISVCNSLLAVLAQPFTQTVAAEPYQEPSAQGADYKTFCGT